MTACGTCYTVVGEQLLPLENQVRLSQVQQQRHHKKAQERRLALKLLETLPLIADLRSTRQDAA
jgi:hypothetical protein